MIQSQPPITRTTHTLSFDKLSPRDFERLCLWLVEREGYERAEHLGAAGSEQGRDIVAWREGALWAFQCKRVQHFGPGDALTEVEKVLALPEAERPVGLVFLVTCDVSANTRQQVRERCAGQIECHFWAETELDEKVKRHPDIVQEFFGAILPEVGAVYDEEVLGGKKVITYTYRIRVDNREEVKVEASTPDGQLAGELSGTFGYKGEIKARIQELHEAIEAAESKDTEVEELGEKLFAALFDDALRRDFFGFYRTAQREDALLRIELDVDERQLPDVAALPWELMRMPPDAGYPATWLGTAPSVSFSRRRTGWPMPEPVQLRSDEHLRIALVVADPGRGELSPVEYEEIWKLLKELAYLRPDRFELFEPVNPATGVAIDAVLEQKPHILHLIGHARLRTDNQGPASEIALLDDMTGEAIWVNAQRFSALFNRHKSCIVILQSCEGATPSAPKALMDVASQLVKQNIPAVVATQYSVSNSMMWRFASAFYNRLSKYEPVDKATQEGRHNIALALGWRGHVTRDASAPVLFRSVRDGYPFYHSHYATSAGVRKVPTLPVHYELNRKYQIAQLKSLLGRGGGGIMIWGRPYAGHGEFKDIAIHIMGRRGITVLDPIDANNLVDAPDEEYFLSALEQRLGAEIVSTAHKKRKWRRRKITDDRLDRIVAALQRRLEQGPTALIFFALEGVDDEEILRWLWEEVWIARLERLAAQGLWTLFFADTSSERGWWRSPSVELETIVLEDIPEEEVTDFFEEQLRMNRPEARAWTDTVFAPLLPRPVDPHNLYAALEEAISSEIRSVRL